MTTPLTATQQAILTHAHQHTEGKIIGFPDHIKGGARKKVLEGLFNRSLITACQGHWFISADGYAALGIPHQEPITIQALEAVIESAERSATQPRARDNSKQAQVIAMLKRPEGATIAQIMETTNWQAHTVRGTLAGAFKKKLRLTLVSDKQPGGERLYRITSAIMPIIDET